jgi:hypothetical protein
MKTNIIAGTLLGGILILAATLAYPHTSAGRRDAMITACLVKWIPLSTCEKMANYWLTH